MIDERHEELASLYALDLLEGPDRAQFEAALQRDPALQELVHELRETATSLAHTAAIAAPPAELKTKLLADIDARAHGPQRPSRARGAQIFTFPWSTWIALAAAACAVFAASWFAWLYVVKRSEAGALRDQLALAEISTKSAQQQLEAERLVLGGQVNTLERQVADTIRQLANARMQLDTARAQLASNLADREAAERRIATLTERIDTLTRASTEAQRQLLEAQTRIARLTDELRTQGDLANFKIAALTSMLKNAPEAVAVAMWNPSKQEGVLALEKFPSLAPDQTLELWVVEAREGATPISAGVFDVRSDGTTRLTFKPTANVGAVAAFAVSREKKDGIRAHAKPAEVIMLGHSR